MLSKTMLVAMAVTLMNNSLRFARGRIIFTSYLISPENGRIIDERNRLNPPVKHLEENVAFSGYRSILQRKVSLPNGKNISYDIVDQGHPSVVVFNWDTNTSTCTLIREYHPGPKVSLDMGCFC
jgi:hypothetical protein